MQAGWSGVIGAALKGAVALGILLLPGGLILLGLLAVVLRRFRSGPATTAA